MVDTYGGVDLKYFDKFDVKPLMPSYKELGKAGFNVVSGSMLSYADNNPIFQVSLIFMR